MLWSWDLVCNGTAKKMMRACFALVHWIVLSLQMFWNFSGDHNMAPVQPFTGLNKGAYHLNRLF